MGEIGAVLGEVVSAVSSVGSSVLGYFTGGEGGVGASGLMDTPYGAMNSVYDSGVGNMAAVYDPVTGSFGEPLPMNADQATMMNMTDPNATVPSPGSTNIGTTAWEGGQATPQGPVAGDTPSYMDAWGNSPGSASYMDPGAAGPGDSIAPGNNMGAAPATKDTGVLGTGLSTKDSIGLLAKAAGVGTSIYSMVSSPSVSKQDMSALNAQIAANASLGNEARQVASQALSAYSTGTLSPVYQGQYQEMYNEQLSKVKQQLAAQGFTEGSTQWQSAMSQFNSWSEGQKSTLLQKQLGDAMNATGMSTNAIQEYYQKWGLTNQQASIDATNSKTAGAAIGNAATGIGGLFDTTKSSTSSTPKSSTSGVSGLFNQSESATA